MGYEKGTIDFKKVEAARVYTTKWSFIHMIISYNIDAWSTMIQVGIRKLLLQTTFHIYIYAVVYDD